MVVHFLEGVTRLSRCLICEVCVLFLKFCRCPRNWVNGKSEQVSEDGGFFLVSYKARVVGKKPVVSLFLGDAVNVGKVKFAGLTSVRVCALTYMRGGEKKAF